jgi:hypothetical protein
MLTIELDHKTAVPTPTEGTTIQDVINFIDSRKHGTGLSTWSNSQIGSWVWACLQRQIIRVAFDNNKVIGVAVFEPNFPHGFLVDQIWANKLGVRLLLKILTREFPEVSQIWGWRVNHLVSFNLKTLLKIYGR